MAWFLATEAMIINFESDVGAIPDDFSLTTAWKNGRLMNETLVNLTSGDVFVIPNKTFFVMGGIQAQGLNSVTIQIDGTLLFSDDIDEWPCDAQGSVLESMYFESIQNVTFTSSGMGLIDGNGGNWWGFPGIGFLLHGANRPRLLVIKNSQQILVENLFLKNSPSWHFWADYMDGLEVRYSHIDARRTSYDGHDIIDLTAFNTDGFDFTGKNIWIHDCSVWNQDDCFCVKDGTENVLVERVNASGLGLTIGSIGGSIVRNVTFRDVYMPNTFKGIYMKFRDSDSPGLITDILYENIYIESPEQWAIWIGPAQQSDSDLLCAAHPCSLCWPTIPFAECLLPATGSYQNITLRNVTISNPYSRLGVIMANQTNPMNNVVFDGVRVINMSEHPSDYEYYQCEGVVNGIATGDTWPVPSCFQDQTIRSQMVSR